MIFIRYYENLIVDDSVDMEITQFKELMQNGIATYGIYAICVSDIGNGIMEILSSSNIIKSVNQSKNYGIIAIAKGEKNIKRMLCKIIEDWLKTHSDLSLIKIYYNNRCY